jgi:hypothetical protein
MAMLSTALLVSLLAGFLIPAPMQGQEIVAAGAPAQQGYGPALFLLPATGDTPPAGLTVHGVLRQGDTSLWLASGTIEAGAAAGAQLLEADTTARVYYLADPSAATAIAATPAVLLASSDDALVLGLAVADELALLESLPAQGYPVSLLSPEAMVLADPDEAAPIYAAAVEGYSPFTAALINQLTEAELNPLIQQLSGAASVTVGGVAKWIATRYTFSTANSAGIRTAEQYIYEYYQKLGIPVSYFNWVYGSYSGRNIVAEIRGTVRPERIWFVGGHFDSISQIPYSSAPGADDNATGTAATMVMAKILKNLRPQETVRFIHFSGEEQGHWGSKVYARWLRLNGAIVPGFLNLDMIGYDSNGNRRAELHAGSGPKSNALADQFFMRAATYGTGLDWERKASTSSRFSDHSSFWDQDYASIFMIEDFFADNGRVADRNPWYHNTGDIATRVNLNYTMRIARTAMATLVELAGFSDSGGPTPTPTRTAVPPTPTPTATRTPAPGACYDLILNGGFESTGSWLYGNTPSPAAIVTSPVFAGSRAVRLGIAPGAANVYSYSTAYQRLVLPANVTSLVLRYWERPGTTADGYDYRESLLLNSSLAFLARGDRTYTAGINAWNEKAYNLYAYRGQTVYLYFNVLNNGSGNTMVNYLDNVRVIACTGAATLAASGDLAGDPTVEILEMTPLAPEPASGVETTIGSQRLFMPMIEQR